MLAAMILAAWTVAASRAQANAARLQVPSGFAVQLVADSSLVKFPMFAVFDNQGRLFVAESSGLDLYAELVAQTRKCRIRVLEDLDGDGRFDSSHVFADRLVFPMGLAWRQGKLLVADPPDVVVLEDTDGDGRADKRSVILTGFGHTDNGSLHGLVFGPDGWLYMTMGSPDGYRIALADGKWLEGESGALIRCREDGSDPQVICRGFENLVEVVFTRRGEVFGTVNWFRDVNQPGSDGLRDALVHLVDGGLYPYHREVGTPQPVTGKPLGAMSLFPALALSGLTQYRGDAFPVEMRGNLFSAQHNSRKIGRHELIPAGSTYRAINHDFVTTEDPDFHPSDVLEDADGSLLIVDTGSWYIHHCPTGQIRNTRARGGIYRVRRVGAITHRDPWGLKEDWRDASMAQLCALLTDSRPAIRDRAFDKLVAAGDAAVPSLSAVLHSRNTGLASETSVAKLNVLWILSAIGTESALDALRSALHDTSDQVVATAARALGRHHDKHVAPTLCALLSTREAGVRMAAAESLAHCGTRESLPAIWDALAGEPDRFLEHALIHAVHQIADTESLASALRHASPRVRKAAIILLSQPPRPRDALTLSMLVECIGQNDVELRDMAISILLRRPKWSSAAVVLVKQWLDQPDLSSNEHMDDLSAVVHAFQANPDMQNVVADALVGAANASTGQRVALLKTLARSKLTRQPNPWIRAVARALEDVDGAIRLHAVRAAAVWQLPRHERGLAKIADSEKEPIDLRSAALRAVATRRSHVPVSAFNLLVEQLAADVSPLRRIAAAEILGQSSLSDSQLNLVLKTVAGDPLISPDVVVPAVRRLARGDSISMVLDFLGDSIQHGWRPSEAHLREIVESLPAADQKLFDNLVTALRQHQLTQASTLRDMQMLLRGGDAQKGKSVFFDRRTACATCHRIGTEGGDVGPDLTRIGSVRAGQDILESIIFPSASFAQGYESYLVTTTDGRSITGRMVDKMESSVFLRGASGVLVRLNRSDVDAMQRSPTSLMPGGLSRLLSRDQLRDLLAYLQTLK